MSVPQPPVRRSTQAHPQRRLGPALMALLFVGLMTMSLLPAPLGPEPVDAQAKLLCQPKGGTASTSNDQKYDDYEIVSADITMTVDGKRVHGERFGAQSIFEKAGPLRVVVEYTNSGNDPAQPLETDTFTIQVKTIGATTQTKAIKVKDMAAGGSGTAIIDLDKTLAEGQHELRVELNPKDASGNREHKEECKDGRPNPSCPEGGANGCQFEYYDNNDHVTSLLVGRFPDLTITKVHVEAPARAGKTASADTKASFEVTVKNVGPTVAFAHTGANPGDDTFDLRLDLPGATCGGVKDKAVLEIDQLAADDELTHKFECDMKGLAGKHTAKLTIDATEVVIERNEEDNEASREFVIPAPDIVVNVDSDANRANNTYLVPIGEDFSFDVIVDNLGTVRAADSNGGNFDVVVEQDGSAISTTSHALDPLQSVIVPITLAAGDLEAKTYEFTVEADPDDDVLEGDENNTRSFKLTVARFEAKIESKATGTKTAMGTAGAVKATVTNAGTVKDTIDLVPGTEAVQRDNATNSNTTITIPTGAMFFTTVENQTLSRLDLGPGATKDIIVHYTVPRSAQEGDLFDITAFARSRTLGDTGAELNLTYETGPDDVPPTASLHEPKSGVLRGTTVTVKVVDNVEVSKVEVDTTGSYTVVSPINGSSDLYQFSVEGISGSFDFKVRSSDVNGNEGVTTFKIVRDAQPPIVGKVEFRTAENRPAFPGTNLLVVVNAKDDNMAKVTMRVWQPGHYDRNFTMEPAGADRFSYEWKIPARPGRYFFDIEAVDLAGNSAKAVDNNPDNPYPGRVVYFVPGINLEVMSQPRVSPSKPSEIGQAVTFSYRLKNTNEQFATDLFEVRFAVDAKRFIGREILTLAPGEERTLQFRWNTEPGPHQFTLVIDSSDKVAESVETDNLHFSSTRLLFPNQAMFTAEDVRDPSFLTFTERIGKYWFVPVLLAVNVTLFAVATILRRQSAV